LTGVNGEMVTIKREDGQVFREAFHVDAAQTTESPEVELKAGDRLVAQLRNLGGPRHFMLMFVSSDRQSAISFLHTAFKILPDPETTDFNRVDYQKEVHTAKQDKGRRQKPLPFKSHSEWVWGEADITTLGAVITSEMFEPLPS
jgi:hypothetical protein